MVASLFMTRTYDKGLNVFLEENQNLIEIDKKKDFDLRY
ncbi:hypothetical protein FHS15_001638 [Paenibacillus castaneae]|nr:hypothetical protein [Paenibacillus castaneae]